MLIEHDCGASDIPSLLDPPESDVLLSTAHELIVVDGTELEAEHVELSNLLGKYLGFLARVDLRYIPNDDHFFSIAFSTSLFADACKEATIWRERDALKARYWHGEHLQAPAVMIVPDAND